MNAQISSDARLLLSEECKPYDQRAQGNVLPWDRFEAAFSELISAKLIKTTRDGVEPTKLGRETNSLYR